LFASKICKHTISNTIVFANNQQLIASGVGQTSRVDALKQAVEKATNFNLNLVGSVMASDAFFPFPDCVELAKKSGITGKNPGKKLVKQVDTGLKKQDGTIGKRTPSKGYAQGEPFQGVLFPIVPSCFFNPVSTCFTNFLPGFLPVIPDFFASSTQSGNGKKASEAITEPTKFKLKLVAFSTACFRASTLEVWPTPLAINCWLLAKTIVLEIVCLQIFEANKI
jgi:hypothetical protein